MVKMRGMLAVNDAEAYLSCGVEGLGIIRVPRFMAESRLFVNPSGQDMIEAENAAWSRVTPDDVTLESDYGYT